jgi:hypothetical protein
VTLILGILQVFGPVAGLAVNVFMQILIFRCDLRHGLLRSIVLGFMAGLAFLFMEEFWILHMSLKLLRDPLSLLMVNLMTYCSLGYCYFHFINLGETARRIRILRELCDSKDGLPEDAILHRYNSRTVIANRIARLINTGQVQLKDGKYYIGSPTMLFIAHCIQAMRAMITGDRKMAA